MAGWSTRTSMSAHRPVRRAMFAISSRKALCLAERACPHGHVVACLPSLSRAAPHSVPSRFLFLHRLPGSDTGLHNRNLQSCAQSECRRLGAGGNPRRQAHWRCQERPGVCCWHQCDLASLWWVGSSKKKKKNGARQRRVSRTSPLIPSHNPAWNASAIQRSAYHTSSHGAFS